MQTISAQYSPQLIESDEALFKIRQALIDLGFTPIIKSSHKHGLAEATCKIGDSNECKAMSHVKTTIVDAVNSATIKAIIMCCQEIGVNIDLQSKQNIQKNDAVVWSFNSVAAFKTVDELIAEMERCGLDTSPVTIYRNELWSKNKRLTTRKVAEKFFKLKSQQRITHIKQKNIEVKKQAEQKKSWGIIFSDLISKGVNEDFFKKSIYAKEYKNLVDFCKFATEYQINAIQPI